MGLVAGRAGSRADVVALCALAMVVATSTNFLIGTLAPFLVADSIITVEQIGLVTGAYYVTAILVSPAGGRFTDRHGAVTGLFALFGVQAVAMAVYASSTGAFVLAAGAVVGGVAQSVANPSTNHLVVQAFPAGGRAFALGVKQAGVPLAALLAGALAPAGAEAFGWRAVCVAVMCVGIAMLVVVQVRLRRLPPAPPGAVDELAAVAPGGALRQLNSYALLMGVGTSASTTYVVIHAVDALGFTPALAGALAAEVGLLGGAVRLVSAVSSERGGLPLQSLRRMALAAAVGAVVVGLAPHLGTWTVWLGVALLGGSVMGWQGAGQIALVGTAGVGSIGSASGVLMRWFFTGQLIGPLLFGLALAAADTYLVPWLTVAALCVVAAVVVRRSPT